MEALRFQIFLWLLNYWRMYRPEKFDMADAWREICESMPLIPECAREGCDTLLFGYMPYAVYCSPECGEKDWREAHPKYMKEKSKAFREANPDYIPPCIEANPDYFKEISKDWRAKRAAERLAAEEQTST